MDDIFVTSPDAPYYAVIFSFTLRESLCDIEQQAYIDLANTLLERAQKIDGFLGEEVARSDASGMSISVTYWRDEDSIKTWRDDARHIAARDLGKKKWYDVVKVRVCKVERSYDADIIK